MALSPQVCKKNYKVAIPDLSQCDTWLVTVTDEQSITEPDKDHAYLADNGDLFVYDGTNIVKVSFVPVYTTEDDIDEFVPSYVVGPGDDPGIATNDYNDLVNKPQINSVILTGNKQTEDLNLYETVSDQDIDEMFE